MTNHDDSSLTIEWRRGLIPLSLLIMVVLRFGLGAPLWSLVLFSLWIPAYYLGYPWLLRRRWRDFEKEFTVRFQRDELDELLEDYQSRWFLRKFGPRAQMLDKLGLIYAAMDQYREAERVFERALDAADHQDTDKLFFNLANVKYELGKYEDAEQIYRSLQGASPYRRSIETQLALIDLHKGRRVEEARQFLEDERDRVSDTMRNRIERALE